MFGWLWRGSFDGFRCPCTSALRLSPTPRHCPAANVLNVLKDSANQKKVAEFAHSTTSTPANAPTVLDANVPNMRTNPQNANLKTLLWDLNKLRVAGPYRGGLNLCPPVPPHPSPASADGVAGGQLKPQLQSGMPEIAVGFCPC